MQAHLDNLLDLINDSRAIRFAIQTDDNIDPTERERCAERIRTITKAAEEAYDSITHDSKDSHQKGFRFS